MEDSNVFMEYSQSGRTLRRKLKTDGPIVKRYSRARLLPLGMGKYIIYESGD